MNRRQLFTALAAAALVPSELWVPKKRTFFLPPMGGWWRSRLPGEVSGEAYTRMLREEFESALDEGLQERLERTVDWVNARRKPRAMPTIAFPVPTADWGKIEFVVIAGGARRR